MIPMYGFDVGHAPPAQKIGTSTYWVISRTNRRNGRVEYLKATRVASPEDGSEVTPRTYTEKASEALRFFNSSTAAVHTRSDEDEIYKCTVCHG